MTDVNPYAPPDASGQPRARIERPREGWQVRSTQGGLALIFIAFLTTFDIRRGAEEMWFAGAVVCYLAFTSAFVAVTGRWFSLRRLFRGPT